MDRFKTALVAAGRTFEEVKGTPDSLKDGLILEIMGNTTSIADRGSIITAWAASQTAPAAVPAVDKSIEYGNMWAANEIALPPDIPAVINYLTAPPNYKIPLNNEEWITLSSRVGNSITMGDFFRQNTENNTRCTELLYYFGPIIKPKPTGTTESSFVPYWMDVMMTVATMFKHKIIRDSSKGTSTGRDRPDYGVQIKGLTLLRGEEKGPGTRGDPRAELTSKLKLWPAGLPWMPAYSAEENMVSFWIIIDPGDGTYQTIFVALCDFNINHERLKAAGILRNMHRLLYVLSSTVNRGTPLPWELSRQDGTEVKTDDARYVIKHIPREAIKNILKLENKLRSVYELLEGCPYTDHSQTIENYGNFLRIKTYPVGQDYRPKSTLDIYLWLQCMVHALKAFKLKKIVHRDIRWDNIVRNWNSPQWFLIDFVDAHVDGIDDELRELGSEHHAPEVNSMPYSLSIDIWGLGFCLGLVVKEQWHVDLSVRMRGPIDQRPTLAEIEEIMALNKPPSI